MKLLKVDRCGLFAAMERPFQSFNFPTVRNFVLTSTLFFLSVIMFPISKSWIAIYSLAYPFPWAILATSYHLSCSTSSSLVRAESKLCHHPWIIPEFTPVCSSTSALSNCNSMGFSLTWLLWILLPWDNLCCGMSVSSTIPVLYWDKKICCWKYFFNSWKYGWVWNWGI